MQRRSMVHRDCRWLMIAFGAFLVGSSPSMARSQNADQVREAMHRAVHFFQDQASVHGGYVYQWSADLSKREGEGKVDASTAWVQPPGTPAVGMAYLNAYRLCGDPLLLDAARHTANALLQGQLESGGWDNRIEFDPQQRAKYSYRVDRADQADKDSKRRRNVTTLDDNKSQSAASFLMQLDRELEFKDPSIHEAVTYALDCLVKAQYANGAWPQRYSEFPDASSDLPRRATIPSQWPRQFPGQDYAGFYTLNDNTMSDMIVVMLDAWDIYDNEQYLQSAIRGGEFFLNAQLPEPQPGWAQQYDRQMQPAWARKFEPPAVSGGESQGVMRTLMLLYRRTVNRRPESEQFLEPLPRALAYYRRSLLDDGKLARFYELQTNRPLYFTKQYELTYTPDDLPTHYGFIVSAKLDQIEAELERVRTTPKNELWKPKSIRPLRRSESSNRQVTRVINSLDLRGAWVEAGRLQYHGDDDATREVIRSVTFRENLSLLAGWLGGN